MTRKTTIEVITALLVLLFAYAATSKLMDYGKFVFQMRLVPLPLMKNLSGLLGWLVPLAEIATVILLLWKKTRVKGILASLILLIAFEAYIASMLFSGLDLPCTCGGLISLMSWKQHLIFNAFFIALCIIGITLIERSNETNEYDNKQRTQLFSRV